uniref:FERM domain-containing protein n=1 Tax=Panagrolaimus davidi TaxID=227884 RepID=A0A914R562_9BILA
MPKMAPHSSSQPTKIHGYPPSQSHTVSFHQPIPAAATSQIPHGIGLPPPPGLDPRKGKLMCIKVRMLDDTTAVFHLGLPYHKATGQALFDEVCRHLNLLESDYFGLEFIDVYGNKVWLDKEKSILRQITSTQSDARFYFIVKFYTPNPADLEEEYTRYLISLQIRRDLAQGEFVCNENTAALLVAYIVQADCGDFSFEDYPDHTYLSPISFIPHQTVAFQIKVMEIHKQLIRCDFYGIKLHIAKDIEGTDVNLSINHNGVKVFHHLVSVSVFSWAKIRKLSFKRNKLHLKLHPESNPYYKETVEFMFDTRNECKNFWKKCVEHHAFFRCIEISEPKKEHKLFSRGSSFRYHGRTQKQLIDYVREHHKRREPFSRPLRPSASRSGSAQRHIQFNVIDATTGSLTKKPKDDTKTTLKSNGNGIQQPENNAAYYSSSEIIQSKSKNRPKSIYHPTTSYISDNERQCVSDLETSNKDPYIHQKTFKTKNEPIKETTIISEQQQQQHADPMSLSLPNVLGDDIKIVCREFEIKMETKPQKSASGDNFLEQVNNPNAHFDYYLDNMSEGSYKLHDLEHGGASSSQSDVASSATDPRVYSTTFTTKRIGNVVVKKIGAPKTEKKHRSDDDDDSSGYSENNHRAKSVPSSRYAQVMRQSLAAGGITRFRGAVPIPIDGPEATPPPQHSSSNPPIQTNNIIRPVVLSPTHQRSSTFLSAGKLSSFENNENKKILVVTPTSNISSTTTDESKYAVVHRIKQPPPPQNIGLSSFSPVTPESGFRSIATSSKSSAESKHFTQPKEEELSEEITSTYGASGPIKGKVIHKENLIITPEGISVRESVKKMEKPKVPPKPKTTVTATVITTSHERKPTPPTVFAKTLKSTNEISFDSLLEPLESVLKDAQELSVFSKGKQPEEKQRHEQPTLISVESVDRPEIKKLHLFNSQIPYTLTMRNLDSSSSSAAATHSTFTPVNFEDSKKIPNIDVSKHHKTIDLVQRKRLPSQDSFSSEDHSLSTIDTSNVVDYVMRRRSLSSDRSKKSSNTKRNDPRRLTTQPIVRFEEKEMQQKEAPVAKPEADDQDEELPAPPTGLASPGEPVKFVDESTSKDTSSDEKLNESQSSTNRTESGVLMTDF